MAAILHLALPLASSASEFLGPPPMRVAATTHIRLTMTMVMPATTAHANVIGPANGALKIVGATRFAAEAAGFASAR